MAGREGAFIGEVSRQTGVSVYTIRFYPAEGLLGEPVRTNSGYRVFSPQAVEQLIFIRKAQELGFSLEEIRELLVLGDRSTGACSHVKSLVEEKLASVQSKLRALEAMEKHLRSVLAECKRQLKRRHPGGEGRCPVLVKLARQSGHTSACSSKELNRPMGAKNCLDSTVHSKLYDESESTEQECNTSASNATHIEESRVQGGLNNESGNQSISMDDDWLDWRPLAASLCCILPLRTAALGVAGFAPSAFFAAWRPYLLALTVASLGAGFYLAYRARVAACEPSSLCERPGFVRTSRAALCLVAVLVIVLLHSRTIPELSCMR